jgi:ribosomal protein L7/L12
MAGGMDGSELSPFFAQIGQRLQELEAQVEVLSRIAGVPYATSHPPVPPEIVALARSGKIIEAIKQYRELTNVGMEEAKAAVLGL